MAMYRTLLVGVWLSRNGNQNEALSMRINFIFTPHEEPWHLHLRRLQIAPGFVENPSYPYQFHHTYWKENTAFPTFSVKRNIHKFVTFFLFTPCNIKGNNYLCSRMIQGRFYKLDSDSLCRSYRCALHSVTLWLLLCLVGTKTSGTIGTNPSLANLWTLPI